MTGLLAEFATEDALTDAAAQLRRAFTGAIETHTPAALEAQHGTSVLPVVILVAGLLGAALAFGLQVYATTYAYPLIIGGRPNPGWPALMPMTFEVGVLSAVAAGVFGFLVANRMPALYDPVDEIDAFRRASRDGYFLALRSDDGAAIGRARAMLAGMQPVLVEEFSG